MERLNDKFNIKITQSSESYEDLTDFFTEWYSPNPYIVAHTSGSTGAPKEILLSKDDMRQSARATNTFFGIDAKSVIAMPLSVRYIAGKMVVVRAMEAGCAIFQMPVSNKLSIDSPIDLLPIVPSQIASLLEQPQNSSLITNVLIGGAAPTNEQCRDMAAAGYRIWISYGMTETCSHVAISRGDDATRTFRAMPGVRFTVTDDSRLIINRPSYNIKRLETNDIVELLTPTAFRWRGRADGVINSGGIKYIPEELEAEYSKALTGFEYYVTCCPDLLWGQAVVLVAESATDISQQLMDILRDSIADSRRLPKRIICVPLLPRTTTGKIRRVPPAELTTD